MGIVVYSLLWVMQDLYHQPYDERLVKSCTDGHFQSVLGDRCQNPQSRASDYSFAGFWLGLSGSELKLQAWSKVRGSLLQVLCLGGRGFV